MKSYILKFENTSREMLIHKIESNGGEIEYTSPVLPIMGAKMTLELKTEIEENFQLSYIVDKPNDGRLQEIKGSLAESHQNPVLLFPNLSSQGLKNLSQVGWGTTVAVLDSGISENWVTEHYDFTGFGSTPIIDHGTKVSNIVRRFAPGSKILSFKIAQDTTVDYFHVLDAIHMAVGKSDILNMSLGFNQLGCTPQQPCTLCETVNYYTVNSNKLFIVAAGNSGEENTIQCPGKSQESVTVGSVKSESLELADYSSRGVPGVKKPNIITTGTIYYSSGPSQGYSSGTSFSTPVITGVVAAMFYGLNMNISKAKSYLYTTAKDIELPEHHQGFGLLDMDSLLEALKNDQSNSKSEGQGPN